MGAVTILDTQSKKKIFLEKSAHAGPCRDIAMAIGTPDLLVSCSYDCNVNVYDRRKRQLVNQIKQQHPLACVALSPCGVYVCTGNLKGDISSYDLRHPKQALDTKRAHDDRVVRVGFVPPLSQVNISGKSVNYSTILKDTLSNPSSIAEPRLSIGADCPDSFAKFIDVHQANFEVNARQSSPQRRDSWLDLVPRRQINDFSMDSMAMSPSRVSIGGDTSELRLRRVSRRSFSVQPPDIGALAEEATNAYKQIDAKRPRSGQSTTDATPNTTPKVSERDNDREMESCLTRGDASIYNKQNAARLSIADKENQHQNQQEIDMFARHIKDQQISTPNMMHVQNKPRTDSSSLGLDDHSAEALKHMFTEVIDTKITGLRNELRSDIQTMEANVMKRVNTTENEIKFYQDQYYHQGFSGSFKLFKMMEREIDVLKEGMAVLLRTDSFAEEYYRLKAENEELKRRLQG